MDKLTPRSRNRETSEVSKRLETSEVSTATGRSSLLVRLMEWIARGRRKAGGCRH